MFGGGGSGAGFLNLAVQLTALAIIAANPRAVLDFFRDAPRMLTILVGATLLLPLLQSIPLPPAIWQTFPGRGIITESFTLIDTRGARFPVSLNVQRTIAALFSLMPPFAILMLIWNRPNEEKRLLLMLVVALGIFTAIFGAQQLLSGNQGILVFAEAYGSADLHGGFANHNSAGLFFDIALCALIGAWPRQFPGLANTAIGLGIAILLVTGLVLTRSRSGIALSIVPAALLVVRLWRHRFSQRFSGHSAVLAIIGLVTISGGAMMLSHNNDQVRVSLSRFDDLHDVRPLIWSDTTASIARYWPIGSGIGTFDEVFQLDESLENLRPNRAGRAHNDYLEPILESGLTGAILLFGWILLILRNAVRSSFRSATMKAATAISALIAIQSILDYPLRNQTILCITGLIIALIIEHKTSPLNNKPIHNYMPLTE